MKVDGIGGRLGVANRRRRERIAAAAEIKGGAKLFLQPPARESISTAA